MKVVHHSTYQGVEASVFQPWGYFQFSVRVEPDQPDDQAFVMAVLQAGLDGEELPFDPRSVTHDRWATLFDHGALANFEYTQGPIIRTPTGFKASEALLASFGSCHIEHIYDQKAVIKFGRAGGYNLRYVDILRTEEDATLEQFEQRIKNLVGKLNRLDLRHRIKPT